MLLSSLIGADVTAPAGAGNVEVAGITADSRLVRPGYRVRGDRRHQGRRRALHRRCGRARARLPCSTGQRHRGGRRRRRAGAARRRAAPRAGADGGALLRRSSRETAVAVTGTSGKTSVADFTRQIFTALGHNSASLGTIGLVKPDGAVYGSLTTPDPVSLHKTLAELAAEGVTHLAFEASSHGLDQHRLDGVRLKAAGLHQPRPRPPRLSPDRSRPTSPPSCGCSPSCCPPDGTAVDQRRRRRRRDASSPRRKAPGGRVLTVGRAGEGAEARAAGARRLRAAHVGGARGPRVRRAPAAARRIPGRECARRRRPRDRRRRGRRPRAARACRASKGVKGRLEIVGEARGGLAVVDYAHKPEALAAVLDALRPFATGKLICVMGCGGDRDKGKRPLMGAIAVEKVRRRRSSPTTIRAPSGPRRSARKFWPRRPARARSATAPRRSPPASPCWARAMCSSSPARATKPGRSSATRCCRSPITTRSARHWGTADGMTGAAVDVGRAGAGGSARRPTARRASPITGFSHRHAHAAAGRGVRRPARRARRARFRPRGVPQGRRRGARRRRATSASPATAPCCASRHRSKACAASPRAARRRSRRRASSPSPAASARPAPRKRCAPACRGSGRRTRPRSPSTTIGACR